MTRKNKNRTRTATRLCATCGTPFTWTSRNPRRRFCDPLCKARWWRATNTHTTQPDPAHTTTTASTPSSTTNAPSSTTNAERQAGTASAEPTTSTTPAASAAGMANAVTHEYDPYVAGYRTEQTPSAVQRCPNCNEPIAVINLLVTSAAAYVNTPSRPVTDVS